MLWVCHVASIVRKNQTMFPSSRFASCSILMAIGRCVWTQNLRTAKPLLKTSPFAKGRLVIENGKVSLIDSVAFTGEVRRAKLERSEKEKRG